jgi:hypothetical protein
MLCDIFLDEIVFLHELKERFTVGLRLDSTSSAIYLYTKLLICAPLFSLPGGKLCEEEDAVTRFKYLNALFLP